MYSIERQRMMAMMVMITSKRERTSHQLREKQMSRKEKRKETNIFKHSVAK